jgi:hypothetical protein
VGFAAAPVEVKVGPLPASDVQVVDDETLTCTTPPGPVGLVPVTVARGEQKAALDPGFAYESADGLALHALSPTMGSMAGGTYVELYGSGFEPDSMVWFGTAQALEVEVVSPTVLAVLTPPYVVTTVDVTVVSGGLSRKLASAWSYFNPTNTKGGTWGGPIQGAVNVTVLDAYTGDPVPLVTVVLGTGLDTWTKPTDDNGHVTFSAKDLAGPVQINAAKVGYNAYTVVIYDATNVTLFLQPIPPPPNPGGGTPNAGDPPQLRGRVLGLDKYILAPPTDCDGLVAAKGDVGLCAPCSTDDDCAGLAGDTCAWIGQPGGYEGRCTKACDQPTDCPLDAGYVCAQIDAGGSVCQPAPPVKTAYCQLSKDSLFGVLPSPNADSYVDQDGYYQMYSRNGEVAVVCYGGFMDLTGTFIPMIMGVRRHIFPIPSALLDGQDVALEIPLSHTLRVQLFDLPAPDGEWKNPDFRISIELDGDDGFIDMPRKPVPGTADPYLFPYYPAELTGPLFGSTWAFYSTVISTETSYPPYSVNLIYGLESIRGPSVWLRGDTGWAPGPEYVDEDMVAVWGTSPDNVIGVGPRGTILRKGEVGWSPQSSPTQADLLAVWGTGASDVWVVGAGGTALHFDGLSWSQIPTGVGFDLRGVWGSAPDDVFAVGDGGFVHWNGVEFSPIDVLHSDMLTGIHGSGGAFAVATGADGKVLVYEGGQWVASFVTEGTPLRAAWTAPTGFAVVAGDDNSVHVRSGGAWQALEVPTTRSLRAIWGQSANDLWLAGDKGTLLHWDGAAWTDESQPDSGFDALGLWGTPDGSAVVAVGAHAVRIGPFMDFPKVISPFGVLALDAPALAWAQPELTPSYSQISLTNLIGLPLWQLVVDAYTFEVLLPDFTALAGFGVLPVGEPIRFSITHVLSRDGLEFDIDQYINLDFGVFRRLSWSNRQLQFN